MFAEPRACVCTCLVGNDVALLSQLQAADVAVSQPAEWLAQKKRGMGVVNRVIITTSDYLVFSVRGFAGASEGRF